ncbi:MAG: hypothetical protein D6706_00660 [Chloroflexi bacterium]|nr:MAG: hypothetical protein D6706_00660 [Chloroflexota bacterium]
MNKKNTTIGLGTLVVLAVAILSILLGEDLTQFLPITGEPAGSSTANNSLPPEPAEWYDIYFTNPTCPPEEERTGGLDEIIANDILQAETRVDVAAFDLDAEPIVDALITLEERGIEVRVVTDEDNADLSSIRRLRRNGISVVEDKRRGLMHDKFVVIDGRFLWTGSMNLTTNGVYCNNNNIVRFDSPRLAANYTTEMDEMYNDRLFGPDSPDNTPNETLTIHGIQLENYFAPEKELAPVIARAVARAQDEILFMAFSFTDDQIGEAILGRADAGVSVRGVFETTGSDTEFSYYPIMQAARLSNLEVRTDGNPRIMHHKVIIIDRETVIFGSFNFTDSANRRNDENIVIVHDPVFTGFFVEEFETVWQEAQP